MAVDVQGHLRAMAGLPGYLDDAASLVNQERHKCVSEIVWVAILETSCLSHSLEWSL